ncbi:signal peptide peptidase SppA [alpha proteobacterium U9-1i]|nr:signal peptide peptidase SppA [alpha proteobacterium U9-1i]
MKQFLITVAGVVVGGVLFCFLGFFVIGGMIGAAASSGPVQPAHMVLSLDLREPMTDQRPANPFAAFGGTPSLIDTITRIDAARQDDRVDGIFIRTSTTGMAPAQAEEVRAALAAFRGAGKYVVAHIQGDGARMSMPGYMAVAGADEIWIQEAGEFLPMGLSAEMTFFADTLRRYHLQAQFEAREDYKTAAHELTQRGLTPQHREQVSGLLGALYTQMAANIAADREIAADQVAGIIEGTPYTVQRAVELKLVDQVGWPEQAERAARERSEHDGAEVIDFAEYRPPVRVGGDVIAVVQGEGGIVSGPESHDIFSDEAVFNSDAVAQALLDAANDSAVKAIVFRVSSGGGSAVASDQILAALRTARESGKPIVVSMGEVAASGGYYVATHANEIVASPTTITGSIGVISGKLIIGDAMEHYLSAHTETVTVGSPMVEMYSANRPFNQAERALHAQHIDRLYSTFLGLVSDGRQIPVDQVRAIAGGRVWTGQQALGLRLVDHLGGFDVAVARARALAGIAEDARVQLRFFPTQENPFEALGGLFGVSSESAQALARLNAVMSDPRFARMMAAMREEDGGARAEAAHMELR